MEADRRWGDYSPPVAVLPYGAPPQQYDWGVVAGRDVAVTVVGAREPDVSLPHLVRLVLEAGAEIVAVPLAGGLRLYRTQGGSTWSL
jgi:hypothetical protein